MAQQYNKYNTSTTPYNVSQRVEVDKLCNGFTVFNTGDTLVFVNDFPLFPSGVPGVIGDGIAYGGNQGEIFKGNLILKFNQPLGAAPGCIVIQKFFLQDQP